MISKKERIWRGILMLPWLTLVVLFFIAANRDGFDIGKTAFSILLTTGTAIIWWALACLFAEVFVEE